jgi:hypothetical protein
MGSGCGNPPCGLDAFDTVAHAPEFAPVPPGVYNARVLLGEFCATKTGAEAYRMRFEIADGPHAGRTVLRTWTFGAKALAYTKRDLASFGITTKAQLLSPFPPTGRELHVRLVVALQLGDDGIERNDVKRIDNPRFIESPAAEFLLPAKSEGGPT